MAHDAPSSSSSPTPTMNKKHDDDDDAGHNATWQSLSKTWLVAVLAVMNQVTFGYDVGAISQCLGSIQHEFGLSALEQGIVTSALNFFAGVGALAVSGALLDRVGRRGALRAAACLLVAGGAVVAAAGSFGVLIVGRVLQGLGVGASWNASGIYVTEVRGQRSGGSADACGIVVIVGS
jgi:MFS family permease